LAVAGNLHKKNMQAKIQTKCRNRIVARRGSSCPLGCREVERVMRELDARMRGLSPARHPIEEQLKQCPDAFKVGELIEKMFDTAHSTHEERFGNERLMPPAEAVIPPLV
jgi:hypothetical protein